MGDPKGLPDRRMVTESFSLNDVPAGVVLLSQTGKESPGPRLPTEILDDEEVWENTTPFGDVEGVAIVGATVFIGDPCVCLDMDTEDEGDRPLLVTSTSG